jgi:hypothetical protein
VLLGRDFNDRDEAGAPKVGIVNQKFVDRYFGGASPLGRHVGMGIDPGTKTDIQIVGVVGDTKYESMRAEIPYELYVPSDQQGFANGGTVYVRVLRETLTLAGIGVAIGLAGAYGVTRLIQAQLFGVKPTDLLTMAAASLGIAAVTALAGYIPARRATGIDPMRALRWE